MFLTRVLAITSTEKKYLSLTDFDNNNDNTLRQL